MEFVKNGRKPRLKYKVEDICPRCKEEKEREGKELREDSILKPGNVRTETDKECKETGRIICKKHYGIDYQRYNPNSQHNIIKSIRDVRTGNLDLTSPKGKGDKFERLTSRWLGVKRLSIEHDNHELPYDHSPITKHIPIIIGDKLVDLYGMVPQTKGRNFNINVGASGGWDFSSLWREWSKEFDIEILWRINDKGDVIERGYIIPKKEIYSETDEGITAIGIVRNPTDLGQSWYEKYRITDEEELKKINDIWKEEN